MKNYKVVFEVSKVAYVKAKNESDAVEKVLSGEVETEEIEIINYPIAYINNTKLA